VQFARGLVGEMGKIARMHSKPLRSAGLKVLRAPDVPSVLVELGYVSNRQNLKDLTSDAWRTATADAMVRSIDGFFSTRLAGAPAAGKN
jgi:N-acetylmuramoyl-L-alanine amidase